MSNLCTRIAIATFFVTLGTASSATAAPFLLSGSGYRFIVFGSSTSRPSAVATVDGVAESFTFGSLTITVNEQETPLGGDTSQILVQFLANGDMFPVAAENGFVSLGLSSDPLNLTSPVKLTSAVESFYNAGGAYASANWVGSLNADPWDGFFTIPGFAGGFLNAGGRGTNRIDLLFTVTAIPEPASLTLLAIGLAGLGGARRRFRS